MEASLRGRAKLALAGFYSKLPSLPAADRPALLLGMGYNFEFYDALFPLMAAHVQASMDGGRYEARFKAMQSLLLPLCSEFGIEPSRPLMRTHRQLFSEFYTAATGKPHPDVYPAGSKNPWLAASRRWAQKMRRRVSRPKASPLDRAKYNLGYLWAVERLSIDEFEIMKKAWNHAGVGAEYLSAHCAVEESHAAASTRAVEAFCGFNDRQVVQAVKDHEDDLAGYYTELSRLA